MKKKVKLLLSGRTFLRGVESTHSERLTTRDWLTQVGWHFSIDNRIKFRALRDLRRMLQHALSGLCDWNLTGRCEILRDKLKDKHLRWMEHAGKEAIMKFLIRVEQICSLKALEIEAWVLRFESIKQRWVDLLSTSATQNISLKIFCISSSIRLHRETSREDTRLTPSWT